MSQNKKLTLGEYRVGIHFNPSEDSLVDKMKVKSAELIDLLQEAKELAKDPEVLRLISLSQASYEDAAMWAVKAITKQPR